MRLRYRHIASARRLTEPRPFESLTEGQLESRLHDRSVMLPERTSLNIATDEKQTASYRQTATRALAEYPGAFQEEAATSRRCSVNAAYGRFFRRGSPSRLPEMRKDRWMILFATFALLRHPSCAKHRAAVDCLGQLGAEGAAADIARLPNDDRWEVRASIARVLARWGNPADALNCLRRDSDIIVRGYARGIN